jgi:hypothetical protein
MGQLVFKRTVVVWEEPHEITVQRKSRGVWLAVGHYMGERLEVNGTTETRAAENWREAAEYRGNGANRSA